MHSQGGAAFVSFLITSVSKELSLLGALCRRASVLRRFRLLLYQSNLNYPVNVWGYSGNVRFLKKKGDGCVVLNCNPSYSGAEAGGF